jgi:hypothetical protein
VIVLDIFVLAKKLGTKFMSARTLNFDGEHYTRYRYCITNADILGLAKQSNYIPLIKSSNLVQKNAIIKTFIFLVIRYFYCPFFSVNALNKDL